MATIFTRSSATDTREARAAQRKEKAEAKLRALKRANDMQQRLANEASARAAESEKKAADAAHRAEVVAMSAEAAENRAAAAAQQARDDVKAAEEAQRQADEAKASAAALQRTTATRGILARYQDLKEEDEEEEEHKHDTPPPSKPKSAPKKPPSSKKTPAAKKKQAQLPPPPSPPAKKSSRKPKHVPDTKVGVLFPKKRVRDLLKRAVEKLKKQAFFGKTVKIAAEFVDQFDDRLREWIRMLMHNLTFTSAGDCKKKTVTEQVVLDAIRLMDPQNPVFTPHYFTQKFKPITGGDASLLPMRKRVRDCMKRYSNDTHDRRIEPSAVNIVQFALFFRAWAVLFALTQQMHAKKRMIFKACPPFISSAGAATPTSVYTFDGDDNDEEDDVFTASAGDMAAAIDDLEEDFDDESEEDEDEESSESDDLFPGDEEGEEDSLDEHEEHQQHWM